MKALLLNVCLLLALLSPVASLYCDTCMRLDKECTPDDTISEQCTGYDDVCVAAHVYTTMSGENSYEEGNYGEDYGNRHNPYGGGYGDGYENGNNARRGEYGGDYGNDYGNRNNARRRQYGGDYGNDYGNSNNAYGDEYGNGNGNENSALITTYKGCISREKCQAGFFSMLTEGNRVIQYVRSCCDSDNCNSVSVQMETPDMFNPNGVMCPSCFSQDLSDCESDNYIQCTGKMTQCVDYIGSTKTKNDNVDVGLFTIDTSLRGCATESVCSTPMGRTEIGGGILVYDIYKMMCSVPLIYPYDSGRGSSSGRGRGSSYGDSGSSSYEPGRSSSYGDGGSSSYGEGGSSSYGEGGSSSYGEGGSSSYGDGGSSSYGDGGSSSYGEGGSSSYGNGGSSSYGDGGSSSYGEGGSSSYGNDRGFSNDHSQRSSYGPDAKDFM